jgi:hypothetical protein
MKSQFDNDPLIRWTREQCLYCGNPTGAELDCGDPKVKPLLTPPGTFTSACAFRKENGWIVDVNYPVSKTLLETLQKITGVETIFPLSPYKFKIVVANLHDVVDIKRKITTAYKALIKSVQVVAESETIQNIDVDIGGEKFVVTVPDGMTTEYLAMLESMKRDFPQVINYVPRKS